MKDCDFHLVCSLPPSFPLTPLLWFFLIIQVDEASCNIVSRSMESPTWQTYEDGFGQQPVRNMHVSELGRPLPGGDLGITMVATALASLITCFASLGSYSTIQLNSWLNIPKTRVFCCFPYSLYSFISKPTTISTSAWPWQQTWEQRIEHASYVQCGDKAEVSHTAPGKEDKGRGVIKFSFGWVLHKIYSFPSVKCASFTKNITSYQFLLITQRRFQQPPGLPDCTRQWPQRAEQQPPYQGWCSEPFFLPHSWLRFCVCLALQLCGPE